MRSGLLLTILLVTVALVPGVAADGDQAGLRPVLADVEASYGSEAWKDVNATIGQITTASGIPPAPGAGETGVYQNPYSSPDHGHQPPAGTYLGYKLDANVTLETADGGSPPSDENYVIGATLGSAAGDVPTRLAKLSNDTFEVVADLDGENRHAYPPLTFGGAVTLDVEVYKNPSDPTVEPQMVASDTFTLDLHRGETDADTTLFSEAATPGYDDVGATNYTGLLADTVHPEDRVTVEYRFPGASEARAKAYLHRGTARTPVATGSTGPNGTFEVAFTPSQALPETDDSGLLVLEAHLTGPSADTSTPVLGSRSILLPVTPHPMTTSAVQYERRDGGPGDASTVQVTTRDANDNPGNNSRQGTLYVLKGTDIVTDTSYGPGGSPEIRTARFPASAVQEPGYTSYRLVSIFYDDQDDFYSIAAANRGADAGLSVDPVEPNRQGVLSVTVRNENDNGNGEPDPGLVLTAEIVVRDLPGADDVVRDQAIVEEGQVGTAEIPFTPTQTGSHDFEVNVTAGEVQIDLVGAVQVQESGVVDDILEQDDLLGAPGPGPAAALAAAGIALALRRRRV